MLKRLKVKNFKSLKNFEVELGKFNVLVGRNNSGKSNILDVLSFLCEGLKDPAEKIFMRRGGYKEVVFGGNEENDVEIEADFELNVSNTSLLFEYYLKISGKHDNIRVVEEKLKTNKNNVLIDETSDLGWFGKIPSMSEILKEISKNFLELRTEKVIEELKSAIKELDKLPKSEMEGYIEKIESLLLFPIMHQIYSYKITPQKIKLEYPEAFIDKDLNLDRGCENLALFLLKLSQQDKKKFERVKELLCGVIDDVEDISPNILGKRVHLMMKDRNFDKYFYPDSMSDGTISLLSYITIIESTRENAIICFEEPENYIHARILDFIVDLMKKSNVQIIVATHSLSFIDLCNPEDILIVEKKKGETKAKRIKNPEKLKEKLGEIGITLGESYFSDELKNL